MMEKLEDLLAKNATHVRAQFEGTQRQRLPYVHEQVVRRSRRRRMARSTAATLLVGAGIVTLPSLPIAMPFSGSPSSNERAITPGAGPQDQLTEDLGFWPSATQESSSALCDPLLVNHHAVAAQFVRIAFGWTNTAERNIQFVDEDHIVKEQGNLPSTFAGGPFPDDTPWITLELSRIGDDDCWWITRVSDADNGAGFSVTVKDSHLEAIWDMPEGAQRADLIVVAADARRREVAGGDGGTASVDNFNGPGYTIVLWKGADGTVFSAAGVTLPEGDYSATSP